MTDQSSDSPPSGSQLSFFNAERTESVMPAAAEIPRSRRSRRRAPDPAWPPSERFPYNDSLSGQTVGDIVLRELRGSYQPLIITGYTSLSMVVDLLAHYHGNPRRPQVRLLLGHEPYATRRTTYRLPSQHTLSRELEEYWLEQGISMHQSAAVLAAIDLIEAGAVEARISGHPAHPVHAKIYRADHAITLGSSNLSVNGMRTQLEANERHDFMEGERFKQACNLAEQIWSHGSDYREQFIALLKKLLRAVDWEEALARACAEILDGLWARRYTLADPLDRGPKLWPAQAQGVAQAMWLVDQVGSVLVADATGSGKTRMGAEIMRAMVNRLWAHGRIRNHVPVVVAPPRVLNDWERDTTAINLAIERYPHTLLSRSSTEQHKTRQEVLQRAQVLAIDEAHNFLNTNSNRSRTLLRAAPEHTLLLTATPINRELTDLLTIINLLGPDNFDNHIIDLVLQAAQVRPSRGGNDNRLPISADEIALLQHALRQFTLRRTKHHFNALIDQEPAAYTNRLGHACRYPQTVARYYDTGETTQDERLIVAIRRALDQLNGMAFVHKTLRLPDTSRWRNHPAAEHAWITSMLSGAKALASYHILAALRSSRLAALEHLIGTNAAWSALGLGDTAPLKQTSQTGNLHERVIQIGGVLPANELQITDLPAILRDPAAHGLACRRDAEIYETISKIIVHISDQREATKTKLIATLLERNSLLLAFDARPITLHIIARRLTECGITVRIATAEREQDCERVIREFRLGSTEKGIVALCTDAMSEGINLQAASAIIHLDLPTVVRRLEQRDGRLSRMDSDHPVVESWLPRDSEAFAPRSGEEVIYRRYRMVQTLIGGNVTLPDDPIDPGESDTGDEPDNPAVTAVISPETVVDARDTRERQLDALPDAFSPIRSLVSGDRAIIPPSIYGHYRHVQARVISSVSAVRADQPWVFLCLAGSEYGAPRFVFMSAEGVPPLISVEDVCNRLRELLGPQTARRTFDKVAADQLSAYLHRLNAAEEQLLPRKKQRALDEMRTILSTYRPRSQRRRRGQDSAATVSHDPIRVEIVDALLDLLNGPRVRYSSDGRRIMPNLGVLADRWLLLIRPAWPIVARTSRRKILLLRDLREHLIAYPPEVSDLEALVVEDGLWTQPLDERVVAAIVGVVDTDR
jgi:superfamily II DNA or RNA helicase